MALPPTCPRCNSPSSVTVHTERQLMEDLARPDRITKKESVYA